MLSNRSKLTAGILVLLALAGLSYANNRGPAKDGDKSGPELPAICGNLQIADDEKVSFRAYALGVQIYRWDGGTWAFVGPQANLYANRNFYGKVGTHYGGPTWESNSGSKVVGRRAADCTPDPSAIPWLLLEPVVTDGPGIFKNVSHVQRVETTGGLRPTVPGTTVGEERRVPYTAEYYFYRRQN